MNKSIKAYNELIFDENKIKPEYIGLNIFISDIIITFADLTYLKYEKNNFVICFYSNNIYYRG